jgi:hypothetical protein
MLLAQSEICEIIKLSQQNHFNSVVSHVWCLKIKHFLQVNKDRKQLIHASGLCRLAKKENKLVVKSSRPSNDITGGRKRSSYELHWSTAVTVHQWSVPESNVTV